MLKPTKTTFILLTPIFILLTHYLAVYIHEYAHSFMAWMLGNKSNPWIINFGGTSWQNLLLLLNIDEAVDYDKILSQGVRTHIALIAFAGPGIGNGVFYLISLWLLKDHDIKNSFLLYYFLFWFNFNNLANFYDYVPIRTFSHKGDMAHIALGLNISPWSIYFFLGYIVVFAMWHFFSKTLTSAYQTLGISTIIGRASLMMTCVIIMFGYFGMAGFLDNGPISHFLSATSFLAIPGMIVACWPTRDWVQRRLS